MAMQLSGMPCRFVCRVERDSHAAAVLVARMRDGLLSDCPIWDDLETFDGHPWRGRVDIVTAGFPCQPFSAAGQKRGLDDDRWLWPHIARIVRDVGPRFVIVENVPGLVRAGLPHVLSDLAALGFDAEWGCLSAGAVGAPHRRERFWLVAYTSGEGRSEVAPCLPGHEGADGPIAGCGHVAHGRSESMADTNRVGFGRVGDAVGASIDGTETSWTGEELEHADRAGRQGRARATGDAPEPRTGREGVEHADSLDRAPRRLASTTQPQIPGPGRRGHRFPPRPDDRAGWAEWIAAGGPEPAVRRGADGATSGVERSERLHLLGNGLVPQCATEAIRQLVERIEL